MSKHGVTAGDMAGLLALFAEFRRKAAIRTGEKYPIVTIQEAGLDGFWIHRVLQREGIESHVVDPASIATPRRRRRAKTDKLDGEALLRALWPISVASRGCARWSWRLRPRRRTAGGLVANGRR
jgi:transposase